MGVSKHWEGVDFLDWLHENPFLVGPGSVALVVGNSRTDLGLKWGSHIFTLGLMYAPYSYMALSARKLRQRRLAETMRGGLVRTSDRSL